MIVNVELLGWENLTVAMSYMWPGKIGLFALVSKVIPNVGLDAEMAAKDPHQRNPNEKSLARVFLITGIFFPRWREIVFPATGNEFPRFFSNRSRSISRLLFNH